MTNFKFLFKLSPFVYWDVENLSIPKRIGHIWRCFSTGNNLIHGYFEDKGDEIGINLSKFHIDCTECKHPDPKCICKVIKHEYIHKTIYDCIGSGKRPGEERVVSLLELS